jgi:hypothetical protein
MAAPNIVNVTTITGITTFSVGITTDPVVTVIVSNPASSGKVYKINSLLAAGIGNTTGVTVKYFDQASGAGTSVAIGATIAVPTFSTLAVIGKENSIYLEENKSIGVYKQDNTGGNIDITCSYEVIS